ncbi:MAG: YbaK/EbsC family protein [Planctomycetota bacterium]
MKLETYLRQNAVEFEKHTHTTTYTAQGLAHAEHVSGYLVAKPVVVRGDAGFAICVLSAPHHLDRKRAAVALHEKDLRLATEAEMAELFPDCELGAEPPIGAMFGLRTIMDEHLLADEYVVMQAGTHRDSIRVRRTDFQRVCRPLVAPIAMG